MKETVDRFLKILSGYPTIEVIARIDQQKKAYENGIDIRATECLLFQNNAYAGKLIDANNEAAFEFPIRAIIWEDKDGEVWVKTTDIDYLNNHYELDGADGAIEAIYGLLPNWLNKLKENNEENR